MAPTELEKVLASLRIERRRASYTYVAVDAATTLDPGIDALIREGEGISAVVSLDEAAARGWPVGVELAWLTVAAETSLEAVGITAALSGALSRAGIAANVLAALHHDHLLVPVADVDRAVLGLEGLRPS